MLSHLDQSRFKASRITRALAKKRQLAGLKKGNAQGPVVPERAQPNRKESKSRERAALITPCGRDAHDGGGIERW
jgi:hypothetical protein